MSNAESKISEILGQLPEADPPGKESKLTGPDWEKASAIAEAILAGGREALLELIDRIRDGAGGGADGYKPGYALHCIALLAGQPGKEEQRRLFAGAVASKLGGENPPREAQAFLIRELQAAGGEESVEALGKLLRDELLCQPAAQSLQAIRAAAPLRGALAAARGRNKAAIIQALGALRDAEAAAGIREALGDADGDVRIAAAWALARLGDGSSAEAILRIADGAAGWERTQHTKACLLLAEALSRAETGKPRGGDVETAKKIYTHLSETRRDPSERYAAESAARGLAAIR